MPTSWFRDEAANSKVNLQYLFVVVDSKRTTKHTVNLFKHKKQLMPTVKITLFSRTRPTMKL